MNNIKHLCLFVCFLFASCFFASRRILSHTYTLGRSGGQTHFHLIAWHALIYGIKSSSQRTPSSTMRFWKTIESYFLFEKRTENSILENRLCFNALVVPSSNAMRFLSFNSFLQSSVQLFVILMHNWWSSWGVFFLLCSHFSSFCAHASN